MTSAEDVKSLDEIQQRIADKIEELKKIERDYQYESNKWAGTKEQEISKLLTEEMKKIQNEIAAIAETERLQIVYRMRDMEKELYYIAHPNAK